MSSQDYINMGYNVTSEGENGCIITIPADNPNNSSGMNFDVYVPYTLNDATPMSLSYPGQWGKSLSENKTDLVNSGSNSIVVFASRGNYNSYSQQNCARECMEALDTTHALFGGDNQNVSAIGGSAGGLHAIHAAYESQTNNYDSRITKVAVLSSQTTQHVENEELELLATKGVKMFFLTDGKHYDKSADGTFTEVKAAHEFAKFGGKVIVTDYGHGGMGHDTKCNEGYARNLPDFINGIGELQEYDDKTRRFFLLTEAADGSVVEEPLTYEQAQSFLKNSNYVLISKVEDLALPENVDYSNISNQYGYLKNLAIIPSNVLNNPNLTSDENFIVKHVDTITSLITSSAFLQGIKNNNFSGTTNIPILEDTYIKEFYLQTGQLLDTISKEVKNVLQISEIIKETDQNLADQALDQTVVEDASTVMNVAGIDGVVNVIISGPNNETSETLKPTETPTPTPDKESILSKVL